MIIEVKIRYCPKCDSPDIIKNGTDYKGSQKYHCHHCGSYSTLDAQARYSQEEKEGVFQADQERGSMRGIRRIFGVMPPILLHCQLWQRIPDSHKGCTTTVIFGRLIKTSFQLPAIILLANRPVRHWSQ